MRKPSIGFEMPKGGLAAIPSAFSGDTLGFVPGSLTQKMSDWLKNSIDVCKQTLGVEVYDNYLKEGRIQLVSLGYLIGTSMKDAWCVADATDSMDFIKVGSMAARSLCKAA